MEGKFHSILKNKIHEYILFSYKIVHQFPPEEKYGMSSQFRRASISIMLNYIEGFARKRPKVKLNFYEIAYGSSQETKYILYFAYTQHWILKSQYMQGLEMIDEIGRMLWSTIEYIEKTL